MNAIDELVRRYGALQPYRLHGEPNREEGYYVFYLRVVESPFLEFGVRIGEFAYQLRSALDHLVWQLALLETAKPHRRVDFPIFERPSPTKMRNKIGELASSAQNEIERLQPYHQPDEVHSDPLWLLHQLCLSDKHRLINVVAGALEMTGIPPGVDVNPLSSLQDGDVVARVPLDFPLTHDLEPQVSFHILVKIEGRPRISLDSAWSTCVGYIVMLRTW